ncbi:MAG: sigma-70 family RNA polymerase sigma factor [Patescibacteria group bacterium]|nr:sigma-70 family RNA polymerase sigma factor [Patescibacteria group bacterium]
MNIKKFSDEKLVEYVRSKDPEAFAEIVFRYERKIKGYLYRLLGNYHDCEDVAQEVFLKTFQNLQGFDTSRKFSSWLYRIAHNEAVNWLRFNRKVFVDSLDGNEYLKNTLGKDDNLAEKFDKDAETKKLKNLVERLPLKYREPMILKFYEERSYSEISDILRIPVNTVGTLINRGKEKLLTMSKGEK